MHILLVTNYFEPDSGAAAVRLSRLARLLVKRGHQVTVLTSLPHFPQGRIHDGYRGKPIVTENRDGLRVIQTWLWATPSPRISRRMVSQNSFMLTAFLRGLGIPAPDVVLIEAQPVFTSLAGVMLATLKRRPYVLNISDLWPDHLLSVGKLREDSRVYQAARRLVDATYRGATRIISLSPRWAEIIQGYIPDGEKVEVVYNGVDMSLFHPGIDPHDFRSRYDLHDPLLVAFVGTFATHYDFEVMLDVARHFNDRQDVRFIIAGQGTQADYVRSQLDDPQLSRVRWLHWIERADMPALWNAASLTFWAFGDHPLYHGVIPAKMYEALACGTPIAAAMHDVGARILTESGGGLCVNPGDTGGLIAAIEQLLSDAALRQNLSAAGVAYARQHYDPERVADAYERILKEAIERHRS